jgi:hypothetical protein
VKTVVSDAIQYLLQMALLGHNLVPYLGSVF